MSDSGDRRVYFSGLELLKSFRLDKAVSAAAGLAAAVVMAATLVGDVWREPREPVDVSSTQTAIIRAELDAVIQEQKRVKKLIDGPISDVSTQSLRSEMERLDGRLARLEGAIMRRPDSALAIPMIRRDLDHLKDSNAQAIGAIKSSVDQVYDLTKWLIGALALGVLSLAATNLLTRRRED
jgi:hypothetical protein